MNNRYLVGILTCLAEVAVFGIILADLALNCVQSYFSFPLNDYWTELLIDYSAGPVRRGLPGEILKHISFVPAQILWLAVLIISYVFIYSVFALRMIKLRIPFVLQAGVYLSPLLCFCLYNNFYFVNRDIVLLAAVLLILLPLSSVYRDREKASARKLALCSILMTVAGSAMIFSHAGSCTMLVLPLLVMALVSRGTLDFVIFALIPAVIFLAECLLINTSMSALSPDGIMTVLDEIKSRFPVVPGRPDESVLVTLRSLGAEGQSFWRGRAGPCPTRETFRQFFLMRLFWPPPQSCLLFLSCSGEELQPDLSGCSTLKSPQSSLHPLLQWLWLSLPLTISDGGTGHFSCLSVPCCCSRGKNLHPGFLLRSNRPASGSDTVVPC